MKYLVAIVSVVASFITIYFKGKAEAKEEIEIKHLNKENKNKDEAIKIQKRVIKNQSDSRAVKLDRLRKTVKTSDNK